MDPLLNCDVSIKLEKSQTENFLEEAVSVASVGLQLRTSNVPSTSAISPSMNGSKGISITFGQSAISGFSQLKTEPIKLQPIGKELPQTNSEQVGASLFDISGQAMSNGGIKIVVGSAIDYTDTTGALKEEKSNSFRGKWTPQPRHSQTESEKEVVEELGEQIPIVADIKLPVKFEGRQSLQTERRGRGGKRIPQPDKPAVWKGGPGRGRKHKRSKKINPSFLITG